MRHLSAQDTRVAIFFGGPSSERDISLDSARTFYDAARFVLTPGQIDVVFIESNGTFSLIDERWIYSNTIDDIVLSRTAWSDGNSNSKMSGLSADELVEKLVGTHAFFSFVHGAFGEDGRLEALLRERGAQQPFLGSNSAVLATLYDKVATYDALKAAGYCPTGYLIASRPDDQSAIEFAHQHGRVVVKPRKGGSSDGVSLATSSTINAAIEKALKFDDQALIEQFVSGREFSIIVFENTDGAPLALFPTEVIVADKLNPIYTRLKKYMPGSGASHTTPARFSEPAIREIRGEAQDIFRKLGLSDWGRFDGFLRDDGTIVWSDLNGVPGFGMDSLLFQQSSLFGLDQTTLSYFLLEKVLHKGGMQITDIHSASAATNTIIVVGGGVTSERQVSRMSWLNVIQKLSYTRRHNVRPIFIDKSGDYFEVSAFVTLQHTVEEIESLVKFPKHIAAATGLAEVELEQIGGGLNKFHKQQPNNPVRKTSLEELAKDSNFCFIALHGGDGENGVLQSQLEKLGLAYNGSGPSTSAVCMNKHVSSEYCDRLGIAGLRGGRNVVEKLYRFGVVLAENRLAIARDIESGIGYERLHEKYQLEKFEAEVDAAVSAWLVSLGSNSGLVLKPVDDGCSSGVFIWRNGSPGLRRYLLCASCNVPSIPWSFLGGEYASVPDELVIKLPYSQPDSQLLVEELHVTTSDREVIELTVAVHGHTGSMRALVPSETRKEFDLLTLEEKFCKGVGINVTPPPQLSKATVASIQERIANLAKGLAVEGYARIDVMYYPSSDELVLIEVNSLPGLSAATVTFTQALLTPEFNLPPSEFLESLVALGHERKVAWAAANQ